MTYLEQEKNEIRENAKISVPTLYEWEKENEEKVIEQIKTLKRAKRFDEAIRLISKYPNNQAVQAQKISIYIKKGEIEKAKEIGEKFPDYAPIQSRIAKLNIKEGNYQEAKKIGERFEDYLTIQSQMITIYMKEKNYDKVKEIGEKFKDYPPIQSQVMTMYMEEGNYEKAKEIGRRFENYPYIQSQMIKIYIDEGNYEKAKEIGERFSNNIPIQSQMVTIYIKEGEYEKAKEIGERFENDISIQSQMITLHIKKRDYKKAKEIGERFRDNSLIQSQMITIYIKKRNYKKAKEIGKRFEAYPYVQSQMITIYIEEGNYEKAKEIGEKFKDYPHIQSQMITIYIKEGDYEKAKEIGERFKDDSTIQSQLDKIIEINDKKDFNNSNNDHMESKNTNIIENEKLRKRIYYDDNLDIDEEIKQIEQNYKNVDIWTLNLIKIALSDRINRPVTMQNIINKYIKEHPEEKEHIKILKQIRQRTQSKRRIFDKSIYDQLIDWENLEKSERTIYDTMNPELKQILEKILSAKVQSDNGTSARIKKYINCDSSEKNVLMRLIIELEKLEIDVSKYYPQEYEEYKKIKKDIISSKRFNLRKPQDGEEPESK